MTRFTSFRRVFHVICASVIGALAPAAALYGRAAGAGHPNIILIMADDLGYAELGLHGQKKIRTPNLDRLATEGIHLTQYYAGSPVCAPSRAVLMTGRHAGRAPIRDNREIMPEGQHPLPAGTVTIATVLKRSGYRTGVIGKWGLGFPGSTGDPLNQGFDFFFGYNCQRKAHNHYPSYVWRNDAKEALEGNSDGRTGRHYAQDLFEREALQFIRDNRERPFFLYLPFTIPHVALQVPEDSLAEYKGRWEDPPYDGSRGYLPHATPRAAYAAMVTRMDRTVGRIMDAVRELHLEDKTLIVFTSDNGPTHGGVGGSDSKFFESAGPLRGLKGSVYEGGLRVPFVARWAGRIRPGSVSGVPAVHYDMLPTLAEMAGEKVPAGVDGISLAPLLLGGQIPRRELLYWEFPAYGGQQALRLGNWKGVRQALGKGRTAIELYDLATDPEERHDVASRNPEVVRRVADLMKREHRASAEFPLPSIDTP